MVNVSLEKKRVGDLKPKLQAFYKSSKLGLNDDDMVAQILWEDNGCGINPDDLDKIFRYDYSTTGGGFGLGFVAEHIDKFDGVCDVESTPGEGTRFYMYYKIADKPEE